MSLTTITPATQTPPRERLLRLPEVARLTGLSRSTVYLLMKKERFPKNSRIGERISVWLESEVLAWIQNQVHKRNLR